jgi:hypothetical protein
MFILPEHPFNDPQRNQNNQDKINFTQPKKVSTLIEINVQS